MKPDWATRLQRTFARKYDAGFAKGLMLGKAVATRDEQERIITLLEFPNGWHETVYVAGEGDEHFADSCVTCINIALIKGEQK